MMGEQLDLEEYIADKAKPISTPQKRRKVAKRKTKAKAKKASQKPAQAERWQVERVIREGRGLKTIRGDEAIKVDDVAGKIVRIDPGFDCPTGRLVEFERELLAAGALAVKVLPPELGDQRPAEEVERAEAKPHRQVVLEMAGDDLALRGLLDEVMTEGGL